MGLDNPLHIAALVVLVLLVFGARRLPEIGRSLGTGMREFKESITGESKPPATPGTGELPPAQPQAQPPAPPQPHPEHQPTGVAGSDPSVPPGT